MKRFRAWVARLGGVLPNKKRERDLAAEIDSYLQMHIDDNVRAGMSPEDARRDAMLNLGGVEPAKEVCREASTVPVVEHLLQDLRFAARQLRKNGAFTCTAIFTLALGACASLAIFAFVDAALIKPLPYRNASRLVGVFESVPMFQQSNLSYPDYLDWKKLNKVFSSLDAYVGAGFVMSTPTGAQLARGARVTDGFFRTLGVVPVLGRDFYGGEDLPAAPRTVILSYAVWQNQYGGKRDVLGHTVTLDGLAWVIIGVLPRDFHFAPAEPSDFWTAFHASSECDLRRSCHGLYGVARLRDGVAVPTALANMKAIARQLEKQYPDSNRGQGASVLPLSEVIVGNIRPVLLLLLGGAGLLLLIAGVNVASLLLVRSESRRREIAVRSALGASRARLTSQFVTEGLLLAAAGSMLGLIFGRWSMQLLTRLIPAYMMDSMPFLHGLGLNYRVCAFACAIALLAAALFAVTPILRLSSPEVRDDLAEGSRGSAGTTWRRIGSRLVALELAMAMVLLAGAGLLGKSVYRLLQVDLGIHPDHLATLAVAAPPSSYVKDQQTIALGRQVVTRMAALPGVKSVAIANQLPVGGNGNTVWIRFAGRPYRGEHNEVNERDVSSAYFTTIGAQLLRGRCFTDAEDESKPGVVVINQALAKRYFPGEDPIGKQIGDTSLTPKSMKQIIGIVDDIREGGLDSEIWPAVYYPFNQSPATYFSVVLRTSQAERSLLPAMTSSIRDIDRGIVTFGAAPMSERIGDSPAAWVHRSSAWLVGGFAGVALLLGVVGLYGVVAYSVGQRTREIGVRMALGADAGSVYRLILNEAGRLAGIGILAGLIGSLAAAALIRGLLFGVQSWDVPTLAAVAAVLAVSSLVASWIPARRAATINPVDALRAE